MVDTTYSGGFTPTGTQTVLTFTKDIKFTPGNIPQCNLSSISTVPQSQSDATCGASKVGSGEATINGGILTGKVAAYNGIPSGGSPTIGLHTDVFTSAGSYAFSTTLTGVLNTGVEHADRRDPADRHGDHAFRDDDQQEEVGQEDVST